MPHSTPNQQRCHVVLGMHKSGTTLVAKTLHHSGIPMIDHIAPGTYDDGATYERRSTRIINSDILGDHGVPSYRLTTAPPPDQISDYITAAAQALRDRHADTTWGFKDPRTLLTFDFWQPLLGEVKLIGVYRDPREVVGHYTRGRHESPLAAPSLHAWREYNRRLLHIASEHPDMLLLEYGRLMRDDSEFARLANFVGRTLVDCRQPHLHRFRSPPPGSQVRRLPRPFPPARRPRDTEVADPLYRQLQLRTEANRAAASPVATHASLHKSDPQHQWGVVYVATGAEHIASANRSVRSVRRHSPNLPVALFTDAKALGVAVSPLFDQVIDLVRPHPRSKVDCLWQSPFERTVYLDSDTEVVADISGMHEILDRFDIALAHAHARYRPATRASWTTAIPETFPQFNSGVIAFRGTEATRALLKDWSEAYASAGFVKDQVTLRELLWRSDLRIATLPPEYNVRYRKYLVMWRNDEALPRILHLKRTTMADRLRRKGAGLRLRLTGLRTTHG